MIKKNSTTEEMQSECQSEGVCFQVYIRGVKTSKCNADQLTGFYMMMNISC